MKYKGVIFDLDGVICSTDQYHYKAWKKLANKISVYFDEGINERLRGVSREDSLNIILEKAKRSYSQDEKNKFLHMKNEYYKKILKDMTEDQLSDEVKKTLGILRANNVKLAIGSSSKNATFILSRLGLATYFDAVSDGAHIIKSKPDPEVFTNAAKMLKLEPIECLVVEDAIAGVEAAWNGNFDCAGMNIASTHPRAKFHLKHFSDVLQHVL